MRTEDRIRKAKKLEEQAEVDSKALTIAIIDVLEDIYYKLGKIEHEIRIGLLNDKEYSNR